MNLFRWQCRRFKKLSNEQADRNLSDQEINFLDKHRFACPPCRKTESQGAAALNMLRAAALEVETEPRFDHRVVRLAKIQHVREGFWYWSPAVAGAVIAIVAVLAVIQLMSRPTGLPVFGNPSVEASNTTTSLPTLLLDQPKDR